MAKENGVSFRFLRRKIVDMLGSDLGKVWTRRRIIYRLLKKYGMNDQRTAQWHSKRSEMITASEVTKGFKTATPSAKRELMLKKIEGAKESDGSGMNAACAWGTQFEPIAKTLYCKLNGGGEVVDTSCVSHPVHSFLGASPDGIYFPPSKSDPRWGKLIEFKCPISRKFDETTPIPDAYYHQMQMQMECTGIDRCEYVEVQFKMIPSTDWEKDGSRFKGVFVTFDDGYTLYKEDDSHVNTWKKTQVVPLVDEHGEYRMHYWSIPFYREVTVLRDPEWLTKHIDALTDVWQEVLRHRTAGTLPENPTKSTAHVLSI
jgi:putative phage-type endonuclease